MIDSLNDKYIVTAKSFNTKTKTQFLPNTGMILSNLVTTLPSLIVPIGYSHVLNLYIEINGLPGVSVIFDNIIYLTTPTNINGYCFNSNTGTHKSDANVGFTIVSMWKKNV